MALKTINDWVEAGSDDMSHLGTAIVDADWADTYIPAALQWVNDICRQAYTIADTSASTVGVGETAHIIINTILANVACALAWDIQSSNKNVRGSGPPSERFWQKAYSLMMGRYPCTVVFDKSMMKYRLAEGVTAPATAYFRSIYGDGTVSGGYRDEDTSTALEEGDY